MSKPQSVLVMGAGSWGTALALVLARNGSDVLLWDIDNALIADIQRERMNNRFIPGVPLPENLHAISDVTSIESEIILYLMAVPCHALRSCLQTIKPLRIHAPVCLACKGFEPGTRALNHDVVKQVLPDIDVSVLSGPSFAKEVAAALPTAVTLAASTTEQAAAIVRYFHNDYFRIYSHDDLIGVQVGGAVKNVMAIAAGIADGLGFGANTRTALITRGLNEITQLGLAMGGRRESFMGLSGLGDLILTCTDNQSRNRRLGLFLAKGLSIEAASQQIEQAIEGLKTAAEVVALSRQYEIEMPITEQVLAVIEGRVTPVDAVHNLLSREAKTEIDH